MDYVFDGGAISKTSAGTKSMRGVSEVFQRCFRGGVFFVLFVFLVFQRCFRGVSEVFQRCFIDFSPPTKKL